MTTMPKTSARTGHQPGHHPAAVVEFSHPEAQVAAVPDGDKVAPTTTPFLV